MFKADQGAMEGLARKRTHYSWNGIEAVMFIRRPVYFVPDKTKAACGQMYADLMSAAGNGTCTDKRAIMPERSDGFKMGLRDFSPFAIDAEFAWAFPAFILPDRHGGSPGPFGGNSPHHREIFLSYSFGSERFVHLSDDVFSFREQDDPGCLPVKPMNGVDSGIGLWLMAITQMVNKVRLKGFSGLMNKAIPRFADA
jgi:hypothetical protein